MAKNVLQRKIFQPSLAGGKILDDYAEVAGISITGLVNKMILYYFQPRTPFLRNEYSKIIEILDAGREWSEADFRSALQNIIPYLKKYSIKDSNLISQLFANFVVGGGRMQRMRDFDLKVLDEDAVFYEKYRLFLAELDDEYSSAFREFGRVLPVIIRNWETVRGYNETYRMLSLIAQFGEIADMQQEVFFFATLMNLDNAIMEVKEKQKLPNVFDSFEPSIDSQRNLLNGELSLYYGNDGYIGLTKDYEFNRVPAVIRELWGEMVSSPYSMEYRMSAEYVEDLRNLRAKLKSSFLDAYNEELIRRGDS